MANEEASEIPLGKTILEMKHIHFLVSLFPLFFGLIVFTSCNGQEKSPKKVQLSKVPPTILETGATSQIAEYIRHIFQDKNGNFWFGTNGYGVVHFDGDSLFYYSNEQGFHGQQITGIVGDKEQNIWFATDQGVVKYDWSVSNNGVKQFTNYSDPKYFGGERFWSIHADSKNNIWAGAVTGIFRFDGESWSSFEIPHPEPLKGDFLTGGTSCAILEDSAGNLWFSTRGYGAYRYDGTSFNHFTTEDGLSSDDVYEIFEDRKGNIWFGTLDGGVSKFDGQQFTNFTQSNSNLGNNEVCIIYQDKVGNIWLSAEGFGVYRYDGESFTNFFKKQGLGVRAVQAILEDDEGRLWVGGGGGLYRYDGESFVNVTKNGPWN